MNILSIILCFFNDIKRPSFRNQGWRASFFWILSKKRTQRPPYVECRTLNQHNTILAARTKKTSKGKTTERGGRGRERGRRREREGMCRYIHILIEKRRERGWLSMRGVVAPPPPSNDQAETTFGVADPHTSFSTSILPPPRSFPIPRSSSQASHPSYPKNNCAFRGLLIRA